VIRGLTKIGVAQAYLNFHNRYNKKAADYEMTMEERAALQAYYADDIELLERMINRNLSHWKAKQ
jgi:hypothetical protein